MTNRTMHRETVVGVFTDQAQVERAIAQLKAAGFYAEDISILMQNQESAQNMAARTGTQAGTDATKGAVAGGVLGGLTGLLVGLGALAIPGIGPILAAGPLAAALGTALGATATGAALGAGVGAITGALVGMGVPENEAHVYEDRFRQGGILVAVRAGADRYHEAWDTLRTAGAERIDFKNPTPLSTAPGQPTTPTPVVMPEQSKAPVTGAPVSHIPATNANPSGYTDPQRRNQATGETPYVPDADRTFEQNR